MLDIEHNNENFECYQMEAEKVVDISIEDSEELERLSNELYELLVKLKATSIK